MVHCYGQNQWTTILKPTNSAFILFFFAALTVLQTQNTCRAFSWEKYAPSLEEHTVHPGYLGQQPSQNMTNSGSKLELSSLVDRALKSHPSLRRSWARANKAAASVGQALSSYYPRVSGNVFAKYHDEGEYHDYKMHEESTKMGASLGITYLLLDKGGRKNTAQAAKKQLNAANFAYNQSVLDLVLKVQRQYYAYSKSLKMLEAQKKALSAAKFNRKRAKDFFSAGLNSKSAQLQAKAHVSRVKHQLASVKSRVRKNWRNLACLCDIPPSPRRGVESPSKLDRELVSKGAEELIQMVEKNNPRLQALQSRVQSGRHRVKGAESKFWPKLSLFSSATAQRVKSTQNHKSESDEHEYQGQIGLKVSYDLFNGFSKTYEEREAQSRVRAARAQYAERQLELKQQVEDSLNEYKAAVDKLKASKQFVRDSKKSYQVAVEFFKDGQGSMLGVTRALEHLAEARSEVVAAKMEMYTAAARLAHSCGAFEQLGAPRANWQSMD